MNCLIDYIGIRGCTNTTSLSGVYINDFLQGVEWRQIDQIADADQLSFVGVWSDIQSRASYRFKNDVNVALQNKFANNGFNSGYKLKQITQSHDIGKVLNSTTYAPANEARGFRIKLGDFASNLQYIHIQNINIYFSAPSNITLTFKDVDTGLTLGTKVVNAVSGWNNIYIGSDYYSKNLSVTYNATGITSSSLSLTSVNGYDADCDCCIACTNTCEAYVYGVKGTTQTNDTYGLSPIFSVKCSYDTLVCNNKAHFLTSWAYLLGAELMAERIYSSRINRWTTIDKNRAIELRKEFEARYMGGIVNEIKFAGDLNTAVYGLSLNQSDCCVECDAPISFKNVGL